MLNSDLYWIRLRSLRLAAKLSPEGGTADQLIADAKKIESHLMGEYSEIQLVPEIDPNITYKKKPGEITYVR